MRQASVPLFALLAGGSELAARSRAWPAHAVKSADSTEQAFTGKKDEF